MVYEVRDLKILPKYFTEVIEGRKRFEIRKNDRGFKVGDYVLLREYDGKSYIGMQVMRKITYIFEGGSYGLEKGYCILSI